MKESFETPLGRNIIFQSTVSILKPIPYNE